MKVPARFEDVTADWLTGVLCEKFADVRVLSCDRAPLGQTKQNKVRMDVVYNDAGKFAGLPASVVVKGSFFGENPYNHPDKPDVPLNWGNETETMSYLEVLPLLAADQPRCLAADWNAQTAESFIVMEDLTLRGVRYLDTHDTLSYAEAARFLDEIALIHAAHWDSPEFRQGARFSALQRRSEAFREIFENGWVKMAAASDADRERLGGGSLLAHDHLLPAIFRDRRRQLAALRALIKVGECFTPCIVMGDEHLRNMYINSDGRPGFIDWACRIEGWPQSIGTFMVNCLDPMDRRKWERPLLSHYLDHLAKHGARPPSFEEAWFGYRCGAAFPLLVWPNNRGAWQPEATNAGGTVRAVIAAMDLQTYEALGV